MSEHWMVVCRPTLDSGISVNFYINESFALKSARYHFASAVFQPNGLLKWGLGIWTDAMPNEVYGIARLCKAKR